MEQVARFHDAWVLTSSEHRAAIEAHGQRRSAGRVHFVFVDMPRALRPLYRRWGGIQFYSYLWQLRAWRVAKRLHRTHGFNLFHHVTFANDWMASHIGAMLNVPFIRGPGGGAHRVPRRLLRGRGILFGLQQVLRSLLQAAFRLDPFFVLGRRRAAAILVCNREAYDAIPARWKHKAFYFPVNGISGDELAENRRSKFTGPFVVLSAGRLDPIKGFDLGIRAFSEFAATRPESRLVIVGDGPERARLEWLASDLGISSRVQFCGWLAHGQVLNQMANSHVFLFPSLRDGGGAVVVEAMAMECPVVCLDLGGPGFHVTPESGLKVEARSKPYVVHHLAAAIASLSDNPAMAAELGKAARARASSLYHWDRLGERLAGVYRMAVSPQRIGGVANEVGVNNPHAFFPGVER